MKKEEKQSVSSQMSVSGDENTEDDVLDRDQPGPVSVSPKGKEKPSYTHNADKSDPIDPHLADQSGYSKKKVYLLTAFNSCSLSASIFEDLGLHGGDLVLSLIGKSRRERER